MRLGLALVVGGVLLLGLAIGAVSAESIVVIDARLPTPREGTAAVSSGTEAYVFGGRDDTSFLDEIVRYSPRRGAVEVVGRLPSPMLGSAAVWDGSAAYVMGGESAHFSFLDTVVRYDPASNTAEVAGHLDPGPRQFASAVLDGQTVYLFGGTNGRVFLDEVVRYTLPMGPSSVVARLPRTLMGSSAVWDGAHAYIFGGGGHGDSDQILRYSPSTNSFDSMQAKLPYGLTYSAAVWNERDLPSRGCPSGCAYVFGGSNHSRGESSPDVFQYNPSTDTIKVLKESLPSPRHTVSAVWTGAGANVFGGRSSPPFQPSATLDEIVRFTLAPPIAIIAPVPTQECKDTQAIVTLDGTASSGPDDNWLTFSWSAPGIAFDDPASPTPRASFPLGTTPVTLTVSDGALDDTAARGVRVVDTVPPSTSIRLNGPAGLEGWWRGPVEAELEPRDACGAASTLLEVDGAEQGGLATTIRGEGGHEVRYRSTDLGGNEEPPRTKVVRIDSVASTGTVQAEGIEGQRGWWRSEVRVTLGGVDAAPGSGYARSEASLDSAPWAPAETLVVSGDGTHTLDTSAIDVAGNAEPPVMRTVRIDTTPPWVAFAPALEGALHVQGLGALREPPVPFVLETTEEQLVAAGLQERAAQAWVVGELRVEGSAADLGTEGLVASGLREYRVLVDGVVRFAAPTAAPWVWRAGDEVAGLHELGLEAEDWAGNVGSAAILMRAFPTSEPGLARTAVSKLAPIDGVEFSEVQEVESPPLATPVVDLPDLLDGVHVNVCAPAPLGCLVVDPPGQVDPVELPTASHLRVEASVSVPRQEVALAETAGLLLPSAGVALPAAEASLEARLLGEALRIVLPP